MRNVETAYWIGRSLFTLFNERFLIIKADHKIYLQEVLPNFTPGIYLEIKNDLFENRNLLPFDQNKLIQLCNNKDNEVFIFYKFKIKEEEKNLECIELNRFSLKDKYPMKKEGNFIWNILIFNDFLLLDQSTIENWILSEIVLFKFNQENYDISYHSSLDLENHNLGYCYFFSPLIEFEQKSVFFSIGDEEDNSNSFLIFWVDVEKMEIEAVFDQDLKLLLNNVYRIVKRGKGHSYFGITRDDKIINVKLSIFS